MRTEAGLVLTVACRAGERTAIGQIKRHLVSLQPPLCHFAEQLRLVHPVPVPSTSAASASLARDCELADAETLRDCGIVDGGTLELFVKPIKWSDSERLLQARVRICGTALDLSSRPFGGRGIVAIMTAVTDEVRHPTCLHPPIQIPTFNLHVPHPLV